MPKYDVRFREVTVYEVEVEATSYKEAFAIFKEKIENKTIIPKPDILRLSYEIETITLGSNYDSQSERILDGYKRSNGD